MTRKDNRGAEQRLQEALGELESLAREHTAEPLSLRRIEILTGALEADISYLINPRQILQTPIRGR